MQNEKGRSNVRVLDKQTREISQVRTTMLVTDRKQVEWPNNFNVNQTIRLKTKTIQNRLKHNTSIKAFKRKEKRKTYFYLTINITIKMNPMAPIIRVKLTTPFF